MTNEELLSVAEIVERLATRFHEQAADHEAKMVEHRAAFGVRTEADAKIIAALREQVELANGECNVLRALTVDTAKYKEERDALRAEVAALQERLRASIARGDLAQMKVAALKSQTPKHPVRVGEYVTWRGSPGVLGGTIKQVAEIRGDRAYRFTDGGVWSFALCEPCDPPAADHDTPAGKAAAESAVKVEPKPWDTVRLVRIPSRADVSPELQTNLKWPWLERWGTLNQTAMVVKPAYQPAGVVSVCLSTNVCVRWPICCIDVVRTEPDEIKVGGVVEVFQASSSNTLTTDIGITGKVLTLYNDSIDGERLVMLDPESQNRQSEGGFHYALCDVRKVTT